MPIYRILGKAEVDFKKTRPCHATVKSHIDQVELDNLVRGASAAFRDLHQVGVAAARLAAPVSLS